MASQNISPADRIRELSTINGDVAAMLRAAGQAMNALSNGPFESRADAEDAAMKDDDKSASLAERKAAFSVHTQDYYTRLQAVVARLRRQAYALEEAGIIAAELPALSSSSQQRSTAPTAGPQRGQTAAPPAQELEHITNGGLGNLDVGWLNSRGNKVGAEKEGELIEEAMKLLEDTLLPRAESGGDATI